MDRTDISAETPMACSLENGALRERIAWITDLNRSALLDAQREGLLLFLSYQREHAEQVREMVRREQQCCAFLGFDLQEGEHVATLSIEAPEVPPMHLTLSLIRSSRVSRAAKVAPVRQQAT